TGIFSPFLSISVSSCFVSEEVGLHLPVCLATTVLCTGPSLRSPPTPHTHTRTHTHTRSHSAHTHTRTHTHTRSHSAHRDWKMVKWGMHKALLNYQQTLRQVSPHKD